MDGLGEEYFAMKHGPNSSTRRSWRAARIAVSIVLVASMLLGSLQLAPSGPSPSDHTYVLVAKESIGGATLQRSMDLFNGLAQSGIQVNVLRYFGGIGVGGVFSASSDVASKIQEVLRPVVLLQSGVVTLGSDALLSSQTVSGFDYSTDSNVTGAGVKVAVVDTGVDYTHPALGGSMGVKVVGGYNFVNDSNVLTDLDGHGTAVSGIIAGNSSTFKGVAPGAQLLVYKVFSNGETSTQLIVEALDQAAKDGAKVVNLSLGGGFTSASLNTLGQLLYSQGIELVAAIGNDGPDAASTEAPGDLQYFLSAGASVSLATIDPQAEAKISGTILESALPMNDTPLSGGLITGPTTFIGNAKPGQVAGLNLTGRIAVSLRDHLTLFSTMEQDAANAGAMALIVVNDSPLSFTENGTTGGPALASNSSSYQPRIPVLAISGAEGSAIAKSSGDGTSVSLAIFKPNSTFYPAQFSSRGPTDDFTMKPEVLAPGDSVVAPLFGSSGYVEGSGSSFSTPQVAGTLALLAQVHPNITAEEAFSMVTMGASVGQGYFGTFPLEVQGAGVLNVSRTVNLPFFLDLHYLMLYPSTDHSYSEDVIVTTFQGGSSLSPSFVGDYPLNFSLASGAGGSSTLTVTAPPSQSLAQAEDHVRLSWGGQVYSIPVRIIPGSFWLGYDAASGQVYSSYQGARDADLTILRPDGSVLQGTLSSTHNFSLIPDLAGFYKVTLSLVGSSSVQVGRLIVLSGTSSNAGFLASEAFPDFVPLGVILFSGLVVFLGLVVYAMETRPVRTAAPPSAHGPSPTAASAPGSP
jgi:subtilisin family serine protease